MQGHGSDGLGSGTALYGGGANVSLPDQLLPYFGHILPAFAVVEGQQLALQIQLLLPKLAHLALGVGPGGLQLLIPFEVAGRVLRHGQGRVQLHHHLNGGELIIVVHDHGFGALGPIPMEPQQQLAAESQAAFLLLAQQVA